MTGRADRSASCFDPSRVALALAVITSLTSLVGCPGPQGAPCDDGACDEGVCVAGQCTVQPCNDDGDCPGDAVCGNGTCVARAPAADGGAGTDEDAGSRHDAGAARDGGGAGDGGAGDDDGGAGDDDAGAGDDDGGAGDDDGGAGEDDAGADGGGGGGGDDGGGGGDDGGGGGDDGGGVGDDGGGVHDDAGAVPDGGPGADGGADVDGGADAGTGGACYGLPPICPTLGQPVLFVTAAQGGATLASVVDAAANGALIVVEAGTYVAGVQLEADKTVTLVAEGGDVILTPGVGEALALKGGHLVVQGFTFLGAASPTVRAEGSGNSLHLIGCTVTSSGDGVRNRTGATLVLDRCDIRDNGGTGLQLEGPSTVTNTFVVGNAVGVETEGPPGTPIFLHFTTIAGNGDAFDQLDICPTFFGVIVTGNGSDTACLPTTGICTTAPVPETGFVDVSGGDFHLTAASGFLDQIADDLGNSAGEDVDGDARPLRSGYDCGADEVP